MTAASPPPVILASGSRSRRQMLEAAGVTFTAVPSTVDEPAVRRALEANSASGRISPDVLAAELARAKAEDVSAKHLDALVIGADQVLALDDRIFEKPKDLAEARRHIADFRGKTHVLYSAVAIASRGAVVWQQADAARMTMRTFSDAFADAYVQRAGEVICSSVGAYQLEGLGMQLFERIEGDYFTILGMPLLPVLAELRHRGALPG